MFIKEKKILKNQDNDKTDLKFSEEFFTELIPIGPEVFIEKKKKSNCTKFLTRIVIRVLNLVKISYIILK